MAPRWLPLLFLLVSGCPSEERPSDTLAQRADEILEATGDWLGIEDRKSADFSALLTLKTEVVEGRARARGLLLLPPGSSPRVVEEQLDRVLTKPDLVRLTNVLLVVARATTADGQEGPILGAGFYASDGLGWTGKASGHRRVAIGADALEVLGIGR
ncbi:MAG: hypothetical protein CMH55_09380 [Myxococcales bacterium]|nr:hypothetical protein [Myxococcales bacterium]